MTRYLLIIIMAFALTACFDWSRAETEPQPQMSEVQRDGCIRAGCSGQLCMESALAGNHITNCSWRSEYQCYAEYGSCGRLDNGSCGWIDNYTLQQCLAEPDEYLDIDANYPEQPGT